MTIEEMLRMKVNVGGEQASPEFRLKIMGEEDDRVEAIIHPLGHDGETMDVVIMDNCIYEKSDTVSIQGHIAIGRVRGEFQENLSKAKSAS